MAENKHPVKNPPTPAPQVVPTPTPPPGQPAANNEKAFNTAKNAASITPGPVPAQLGNMKMPDSEFKKYFCSDAYLDALEENVREIQHKGILKTAFGDYSRVDEAKAAMDGIMADVGRYGDSSNISGANWDRFCGLVNETAHFTAMTKEIHYFRNELNRAPASLGELYSQNAKLGEEAEWKLLEPGQSKYHMYGEGGKYNVKFISGDGKHEGVYDTRTGKLVTDPGNMGTYNYAGPDESKPALSMNNVPHGILDVEPYFVWGNVPGDSKAIIKREALANANLKAYEDEGLHGEAHLYRAEVEGKLQNAKDIRDGKANAQESPTPRGAAQYGPMPGFSGSTLGEYLAEIAAMGPPKASKTNNPAQLALE